MLYLFQVFLGIVLLANIALKTVIVNRESPKISVRSGINMNDANSYLRNFTLGYNRTWVQQTMLLTINNMAGLALGAAVGLANETRQYPQKDPVQTHFYITQPQPNPRTIVKGSNGSLPEDWMYSPPLLVTYKESHIFHVVLNKNPEMHENWVSGHCQEFGYGGGDLPPMRLKFCAREVPLPGGECWGLLVGTVSTSKY